MPGQLPTPDIPKRTSLIFLWSELSQRAPIHIANPLLKTVCVFGSIWVTQSYSVLPKYKKITNKFINVLPLLVRTCWKYDENLNVGFQEIIDECSFDLIVDSHCHVFFPTHWTTHIKWGSVILTKLIIIILLFPYWFWSKLDYVHDIFICLNRKLW